MKACCLNNFSFSGFPLLYNPNNPCNDIEYTCWCFFVDVRVKVLQVMTERGMSLLFDSVFPSLKFFFKKKGSFLYFPSPLQVLKII
jgi:hypothetical protein